MKRLRGRAPAVVWPVMREAGYTFIARQWPADWPKLPNSVARCAFWAGATMAVEAMVTTRLLFDPDARDADPVRDAADRSAVLRDVLAVLDARR